MFRRRRATLDVDEARLRRSRGRGLAADERFFTVTWNPGGFGMVSVAWPGTSELEVRNSFLAYLLDDESYNDVDGRYTDWRSIDVKFNGQRKLLTYRTSWLTGFTVH